MFSALFALTAIGLILLHATDGFHWRDLRYGWRKINWWMVLKFTAMMLALCLVVILIFAPDQMFNILKRDPRLMLMIFTLYPLVSALPQEIVFRPLFFRRYGEILPSGQAALVLNAAIFSMAHLMYWSWIVAAMTFAGGLVFAWAYEKQQNFPLAVVLHGIAGNLIFLAGLGIYFYSGNVTRPF
ncbi:CPBP family intramembrane glutamic endopeptidase [Shimia gijangensis]|nr:CPBP family intramembrane glutamic endopeptidase [Shimia gijangensis]